MSVPCSGCKSPEPGKRLYVYVQHFVDDELERTRARLCHACYSELLSDYFVHCERLGPRGDWLAEEQQPWSPPAPVNPSGAAPLRSTPTSSRGTRPMRDKPSS